MATGLLWAAAKSTEQFCRRNTDEDHPGHQSTDWREDEPIRLVLRGRMHGAPDPDPDARDPNDGRGSDRKEQPSV